MNIFARKLILGAICDKSSAHGAVDDILFKAWQDNELHERLLNFKRDLKIRGVDKESLPSYPYRDDGLLVMKAIENYCQSIVKECYSSDELVQSDRFLGDFLGELTRTGYFGWMDDETPAESTRPLNESREYLSQFLSNLVFNVSGKIECASTIDPSSLLHSDTCLLRSNSLNNELQHVRVSGICSVEPYHNPKRVTSRRVQRIKLLQVASIP